jgi:uncharacterized protein YbjT (DUF2867 family)
MSAAAPAPPTKPLVDDLTESETLMPATDSTALPVLVVGATGSLGSKVVDELLGRGKNVRALVRPASDASRLESRGVQIARGDMLNVDSLIAAMNGADAVITAAAGYTRGGKNANDIDTIGNANLAEAAHRTGFRRFVLTIILTSDQTPQVPHFSHKKLAEDKLEQLGVPFVALRPGAFLDQVASMAGDPVDEGRMLWIGKATRMLTGRSQPMSIRSQASASASTAAARYAARSEVWTKPPRPWGRGRTAAPGGRGQQRSVRSRTSGTSRPCP